MYPYQLQSMATEYAKDLRRDVAVTARARRARRTRAGTRSVITPSHAGARHIRRTAHP
jgi:hypothetical protein